MRHYSEQTLEQLLLDPEMLDDATQVAIRRHLTECTLCDEAWRRLESLYARVEASADEPVSDEEWRLARQMMGLSPFGALRRLLQTPKRIGRERGETEAIAATSVVEVVSARRGIVGRAIDFVRIHPVRFAGGMAISALALALGYRVAVPVRDLNPAVAAIEQSRLSVRNANGEDLWSHQFSALQDVASNGTRHDANKTLLEVADLDGDGTNEVLLLSSIKDLSAVEDTMSCYEADGKLRWQYVPPSAVPFIGAEAVTGTGRDISRFVVTSIAPSERPRVFATMGWGYYYPSKFVEIDGRTGRETQEYWHAGHLARLAAADVDGDGRKELLVAGVSSAFDCACLAVFEADSIGGHGPLASKLPIRGVSRAKEREYVCFPLTEVGRRFGRAGYNAPIAIMQGNSGGFSLIVEEVLLNPDKEVGSIHYVFAPGPKLASVVLGDNYRRLWKRMDGAGMRARGETIETHVSDLLQRVQLNPTH